MSTMPDYREDTLEKLAREREIWDEERAARPVRAANFTTVSGSTVPILSTPCDLADFDYVRDLGFPGGYPYTRGVYETGYRGRLWTVRQFSGFGGSSQANQRLRFLLERGMNGLSLAFDMPTLMGFDSDDPECEGEAGRLGVAISSLADMEALLDGIPIDRISTSMTVNSTAPVVWAMYIVAAEKRGLDPARLSGTLQNDILKEYMAEKEYIFPPGPSMRLVADTIEYGARHLPRWYPVSISGCHIRETGATAVQELAFTLANGFEYVEAALARGLSVDEFAPRLSFYFVSHNDLFEEVAKFRAARRIWARAMREKYHARDPRSCMMRFHVQTAGCSLTREQPHNNIVRTAYQALAAVLGGAQSLHTNSMDEAFGIPTEETCAIAVSTQHVLAHETGVANVIDPLGGSFHVEALTNRIEAEVHEYFDRIRHMGGVIPAIEEGFFQKEIGESAYRQHGEINRKERIVVGVNEFIDPNEEQREVPTFEVDPEIVDRRRAELDRLRAERDGAAVRKALDRLAEVVRGEENTMPAILDAVRVYATLGEIIGVLKVELGTYVEPAVL
jgi:methylmalonyl-CoA mutase N-terminal domain/subunit